MSIEKINPIKEESMFSYNGPKLDIAMPGGFQVSIREWNGEDEDALSKVKDSQDGTATFKFLSGIITACSLYKDLPTWEQVAAWKAKDIYYLLYKSRVLTHGPTLEFPYTYESGEEVDLIEDLARFDWDLKKGAPPKDDKDYDVKIKPYPVSTNTVQGITTTGKAYRFNLLTGNDEVLTMGMDKNTISINDKLRLRHFEVQMQGGNWQMIERFNIFSAREMKELRAKIDEVDGDFSLTIKSPKPQKGPVELISLFTVSNFFFPQ